MNNYQPGNHKLVRHFDHLKKMTEGIPVAPIHVSVWPNSKCNFACSYCCGRNITDKGAELSFGQYTKMIDILSKYGTRAVEFSGSIGEPLLWKYFEDAVDYTFSKGLKMSLITNGTFLKTVPVETLKKLNWIRVSIQNLNHLKIIDFKTLKQYVKTSISYIVSDQKSLDNLKDIWYYCKQNDVVVRVAVARPCSVEWEDKVRKECDLYKMSGILFFSEKERGTPSGCYMAYIRAAVDWHGNFLPCPSTQLNEENNGFISGQYALCNIDTMEEWILNNPPHDLGFRCSFCNCGKIENEFVHQLFQEVEDVDFV